MPGHNPKPAKGKVLSPAEKRARGGARQGAGRKPLQPDDPLTLWIVERLRRLLYSPCAKKRRQLRWLRANGFTNDQIAIITGRKRDLSELREEMRSASPSERAVMIESPEDTALGDVREVIANQLGGRRWHRIPEPTTREMGEAYDVVARLARLRRQFPLTRRQIETRIRVWKKGP